MPAKNTEKKLDSIKELQKNISPILVINNSSLKPYIELFEYTPENIYQKPLGNLIGFFEIKEYSEESAYVVNFLTSVLKKEYYTNPRRSVTESFDSALHKVNLALSEVAKHGNVEWIGKLHASICVIEKNSIHFTVAGNAKIFLNRKKILTDIGEGLSSDENEPHPLKTFINVSSGRLEKEDRLIITCEDIFHVIKLADLKKNLERLTKPQFVQFLKTALSNELEMIATIVTDFEEAKKIPATKKMAAFNDDFQQEPINAFSNKSFPERNLASLANVDSNQSQEELPPAEYTDKKTGHIYVQGGAPPEEISQLQHYWDLFAEKAADGWNFTKNNLSRNASLLQKRLAKKIQQVRAKAELQRQQFQIEKQRQLEKEQMFLQQQEAAEKLQASVLEPEPEIQQQTEQSQPTHTPKKKLVEIINLKEQARPQAVENFSPMQEEDVENNRATEDKAEEELLELQLDQKTNFENQQHLALLIEKVKFFLGRATAKTIASLKSLKKIKQPLLSWFAATLQKTKARKLSFKDSKIVPHPAKLKKLYQKMTSQQKINVSLSLLIIFVVPIFIANWLNRPKPATIKDLPATPISQVSKLATEKNISFNDEATNLLSKADLNNIFVTDSGLILTTNKTVIILKNGQQFEAALPGNAGNITASTYMSSLSTLLLLTDQNKIISFTPNNSKFSENKIELANASASSLIGTYLTYLYVLDPASNQITRYPRADGGFGDKISWLKDNVTLDGTSDLTIDDSVYLVKNNQVLKFSKGKQSTLTLESSGTPVRFDKIFTTIDLKSIYALDTQNSRLVQYDKASGAITAQFYSDVLKDGISLAVDEKNKTAYVVTSSGLVSMTIQ